MDKRRTTTSSTPWSEPSASAEATTSWFRLLALLVAILAGLGMLNSVLIATLAELEQYIAYLRSLGAPGDAHPKVGVSDDYEVTMMICVVERPGLHSLGAS